MTANDTKINNTYDHEDKASYDGRLAGIIMCIISVIMAIILIPAMGAIVDAHENEDTVTISSETEAVSRSTDSFISDSTAEFKMFEKLLNSIGVAKFVETYDTLNTDNIEFTAQDTVSFEQEK